MNIRVIYKGPYPNGPVTTKRVHYICKGLVENGASVELLIPIRTESPFKVSNINKSGEFEGIKYYYVSSSTIRSNNFFIKFFQDLLSQSITIFKILLNKPNADINLVIGPSFDFRLLIPIITKLTKAKTILEINEYLFVNYKNILLKKIKYFIFCKLIIPRYNGFIVISKNLSLLISKYKSPDASIIKIPIISEPEINPVDSAPQLELPYIIHAGSLFENKDGLIGVLNALAIVKSNNINIKLLITGSINKSKEFEYIIAHATKIGIRENLVFSGYLEKSVLNNYLKNSSLAIINKSNNTQNQYCFATKITDYLFNSVPLIITKVGEAPNYFTDGVNSIIIEPDNVNLLAEKIMEIVCNSNLRNKLGHEGYKLAIKMFHYKLHGKRLYNFFNNIVLKDIK